MRNPEPPSLAAPPPPPGEVWDADLAARAMLLVGSATAATGSFEARRRQLGGGLAALVDADVWIWARTRRRPDAAVIFDTVDGGFADEAERARFLAAIYYPEVTVAFNRALHDPPEAGTMPPDPCGPGVTEAAGTIAVRTRGIEDAMPAGSAARATWRAASGMGAGLMCMVPLGGPNWSGLGFHRREGRGAPAFAPRERCVAHLVVGSLEGLHRDGTDVPANRDALFAFRPRERQVLLYLLAGDQTKQIAGKLGLSPHTVSDYVKSIYRRLDVRTRPELMRLFLPGSEPPPGTQ